MNLDLRDEKALTRKANGPIGLIATLITYILVALALALSYSIADAAEPTWYDVQLLTRLHDGSITSLPADNSEFGVYCWGYSGNLARTSLEVLYYPAEPGGDYIWHVLLVEPFDYVLWCQSDGIDWYPAVIEDHDPSGSIIILDAVGSQYTEINRDYRGRLVPVKATARCELSLTLEAIYVPLLIRGEWFADSGDGGPRMQWGVQVPWGCELVSVEYRLKPW